MKTRTILILVVTFPLWGLGGFSCSKDDGPTPPENPLSKLPPETQTGANTFGCIINNQVFYPRDGSGNLGGGSGARGLIF